MNHRLLIILLIGFTATMHAQSDSTTKNRWLWYGLYIPTLSCDVQYSNSVSAPESASFLRIDKRLCYKQFEPIKGRIIIKERFYVGAKIQFGSRKNEKTMQNQLDEQHPKLHITHLVQEGFMGISPGIFIGYRQPFHTSPTKTHCLGATIYFNNDYYNYGYYQYDAKAVDNNSFYSYGLYTDPFSRGSVTYEIEKSTAYYRKNTGNNLVFGVKLGVTPRNQNIGLVETIRTFDGTTNNGIPAVTFHSVTVNIGLYLAFEGPFIKTIRQ